MEVKIYVRMLLKGWWIIAITTFVAINVSLIISLLATPMYRATSRLLVAPNPNTDLGDMVDSLATLDRRSIITTYAEVLDSLSMRNNVQKTLQLSPLQIEEYTQKTVVAPEANILEINVTGPNPMLAARWANLLSQQAIEYINNLDRLYQVTLLDAAVPPTDPISPQPLRDAALAMALGLLVGAVLAIIREQLRIPLEAMRQRRITDPVSLGYTRPYFERALEEEALRARQTEGIFSLGIIQLQGLRDFAETLPQPAIDQLIRDAARILRNELRGNDIIGRWDNFSFSLILPSTPYKAANTILGRIRWELSRPVEVMQTAEHLRLEPNIGIARSQDNEAVGDLITRALQNLEERRDEPLAAPVLPQKPATQPAMDASPLAEQAGQTAPDISQSGI